MVISGDDAAGVQWMDISRHLTLYASHYSLIQNIVEWLEAHW